MTNLPQRLRLHPTAGLLLIAALIVGCASKPKPAQQKAAFWPQYPDEPRIQFLTSFAKSSDVEPPKSKLDELVLGKESQEELPLSKPNGVAMWNGRIYVADIRGMRVDVLDLRKHQMLMLSGSGADKLEHPTDVAIASDGMKYVTDPNRGKIFVFDASDRHIGSFTPSKTYKPIAAAVFGNELFVCDFASQTVGVMDRFKGTYLRTIGTAGAGDGQFIRPMGVAVDAQGDVFVADVLKCQVQKFDRAGKLLLKFGTTSANMGGLVRPKQLAVDNEGHILVVDAAFQNVQVFDPQGRLMTFFGSAGPFPGAMKLPFGITIHDADLDLFQQYIHPAFQAQRLIVVTNQFGDNKVSVYAMGQLAPGKTIADIAGSQGVVTAGVEEAAKSTGILPAATQPLADDPAAAPSQSKPLVTSTSPVTPQPAGAQPTTAQPTTAPAQGNWQSTWQKK